MSKATIKIGSNVKITTGKYVGEEGRIMDIEGDTILIRTKAGLRYIDFPDSTLESFLARLPRAKVRERVLT